jgi:NADH-quinone oxidoreductase subunit E/NADP-reducing hydrogenase subunit HndA
MTCQPLDAIGISSAEISRIEEILENYRGQKKMLIPVLEKVQSVAGYLPEALQRMVADALDIPLSRVFGVVTFYSFFTMQPRGKHQIRLCMGTACHVRGAQRNYEKLMQTMDIAPGGVTPDRRFGLEVVRCLGACGLAPVMTVDNDTHRQVRDAQLKKILDAYDD